MKRLAACTIVAAAALASGWLGCRDVTGSSAQELIALDSMIASDAPIGSGSDGAVIVSDGAVAPGSDGGSTPGSDGGSTPGSDAATGSGSDAAPAGDDAGVMSGDDGGGDAAQGAPAAALDRTSFYACAGGGCRTSGETTSGMVLVAGVVIGVLRRRRRA
jgi:MYXO-CTERM domain-containing protein